MSSERTYEEIAREYQAACAAAAQGFRKDLIDRGVTITSPDHLAAEQANYNIAHHDEITALEELTVEFSAARAATEMRALEAHELAARAHDDNARWARMADDQLKKGFERRS